MAESTQQKMTKPQLAEFVRDTIKDYLGTQLAEQIRENIERSVAPLRQQVTDWGAKVAGRAQEKEAPRREPGIAWARCVRAVAAARKYGVEGGPLAVLRQWGDNDIADEWKDFREKAMAAGDASSGGYLVPVQFLNDFVAVLRSATVMRKLGTPTIPLPTGTAKMGKGSAGTSASYVGESTNAPKTQMTTGQLTLTFKKLMALTPISNDLLRYSSPGADLIVRNDLIAAMSVKEDSAFIRGDGTDGSPKGLLNWAPGGNRIQANGTVSLQNTATDLGNLMQKLMEADIPMVKPCWIMPPRVKNYLMTLVTTTGNFIYKDEMTGGTLWGYPFAVTTGVPTNLDFTGAGNNNETEIYFVDVMQGLIGEAESLSVDASDVAAYNDGSTVQASFSRDETVVRAIAEHDFIMRYDKAVSVLRGVTWAPGSV